MLSIYENFQNLKITIILALLMKTLYDRLESHILEIGGKL